MPFMDIAKFTWACICDLKTNIIFFNRVALEGKEAAEAADCIICNSTIVLEPGAFTLFANRLPTGPLLASDKFRKQAGHFWGKKFRPDVSSENTRCVQHVMQLPKDRQS
uniref:Putative UDP-glucuronosyl/UDP-glucosyltransferase n=1 Tax=Tanacetum cinerariifolium TaxID=118510 RepID=A0A6L2JJJ0_TANCI|nr:putative UDP-glucuronosyl/UDP-glucosyltransferase [Tanacetum cinerariifolium]